MNTLYVSSETNFSPLLLPLWSWFLSFLIILQTVGLLGRVISSSQGLYSNTEKCTHTSNIHALSGIRTHDPGFWASKDSTCPRPLGYRDRHLKHMKCLKITLSNYKGQIKSFSMQFNADQFKSCIFLYQINNVDTLTYDKTFLIVKV
jgi:hypothetical protein